MKRLLSAALTGLALCALALPGCQYSEQYSSLIKYGVRTDPLVVTGQPGNLGDDQDEPDRPGVLPLLHPQGVLDPFNPMYAKGMALFYDNQLRDPMQLPADVRQKLDEALVGLFGTPAEPKVAEIDDAERKTLGLDDAALKEGSRLYRIHCVHCHGVPGDGRGPTGRWINPHPRDFRQGLFKFMSVDQSDPTKANRPPRREDLYYTIRNGVEGTAMPASSALLNTDDINHLVSYVIHLSLRGKAEFDTIKDSFDYKVDKASGTTTVTQTPESKELGLPEDVKSYLKLNVRKWVASQDPKEAIRVPEYDWKFNKKDPKNAEGGEWKVWKGQDEAKKWQIRGAVAKALFNNEEPKLAEAKTVLELRGDKPAAVNCKQCHADYGRQAKFKFDSWGTLARPNNFPAGVFRGGRRPVDIYHRIHSGINGSNMTPFGSTITSNSIWDLVEFVRGLSYPAMRREMGIVLE